MSKSFKDPEARKREQKRREQRRNRRSPDREYEDTRMAATPPYAVQDFQYPVFKQRR